MPSDIELANALSHLFGPDIAHSQGAKGLANKIGPELLVSLVPDEALNPPIQVQTSLPSFQPIDSFRAHQVQNQFLFPTGGIIPGKDADEKLSNLNQLLSDAQFQKFSSQNLNKLFESFDPNTAAANLLGDLQRQTNQQAQQSQRASQIIGDTLSDTPLRGSVDTSLRKTVGRDFFSEFLERASS